MSQNKKNISTISVILPTYFREEVLMDTIHFILFNQSINPNQLIVVDQTIKHTDTVQRALQGLHDNNSIKWLRTSPPSQPRAMNIGLLESVSDIALFLDDDIIPDSELIKTHLEAYQADSSIWAVAGKIIQPWQRTDRGDSGDARAGNGRAFDFSSEVRQFVQEGMSGNLSVMRSRAIEVGGFDENFKGAAYKFDTEFCERIVQFGGQILFEPQAQVNHLMALKGGTRTYGYFNKTLMPYHGEGAYYYFLRSKKIKWKLLESFKRFTRSVYTKHHLRRPWWIPVTLIAEFLGFCWAVWLALKGPKLIRS
jgi:GT2 family glycosyltransferase